MAGQNRFTGLFWVLVISLMLFIGFATMSMMRIRGKGSDQASSSKGSKIFKSKNEGAIGVLEVNGAIMDSKKLLKKLKSFEEDEFVKGIVVRINSPGGSVGPSQEIYDAIKRCKKPTVTSMGSVAASGGYYIAVGTSKIFANAGTITGSIGVIMQFTNMKKLYDWAKVERFSIKTGKFKDSGAEYRDMTLEERAHLQSMVDDVLSQFKKAVSEGRKLPMEEVTKVADGRIFSGQQAKIIGLVDLLGGLDDAIDDVAKTAKIEGKPKVYYSEKPKSKFMDALFGDDEDDAESSSSTGSRSLVVRLLQAVIGGDAKTNSLLDAVTNELQPGVYWLWNG
ncbi:MAG: signal peptide peptidase SppA [Xanthomonadaceae bacterium]|nr:signal peptide peptidase SppA [Xanthomonadaceae bacterium]